MTADLRSTSLATVEGDATLLPTTPVVSATGVAPSTGVLRPRRRDITFALAAGWVGIELLVAAFADLLPLLDYDVAVADLPPRSGFQLRLPEPFGTDVFGRSITSRLAYGARQSLTIGAAATALAMSVGLAVGLLAGYFRHAVDAVVGVVIDAVLAMPSLLLLLAIAAVGRRDTGSIIVGLAVLGVPTFARLARASTLALSGRSYVSAARSMGASHRRIIARELLPSVALRVATYVPYYLASVIVVEASLSFLGLGVPPPQPTWGGMINEARPYLESDPYLIFVPCACIVLTVASLTVIGERLRGRWDTPTAERR